MKTFSSFFVKKKKSRISRGSIIRKMGATFFFSLRCQTPSRKSLIRKKSHAWRKNTFATENFNQSMTSVPTPSLVLRIPTQKKHLKQICTSWFMESQQSLNHEIRGIPTPTPTRLPTPPHGPRWGTHLGFWVYIMSCHVSLRINPSSSRALKVPLALLMRINLDEIRKRFGKTHVWYICICKYIHRYKYIWYT